MTIWSRWWYRSCTIRSLYDIFNFTKILTRHSIGHPLSQVCMCHLWIWSQIYNLYLNLYAITCHILSCYSVTELYQYYFEFCSANFIADSIASKDDVKLPCSMVFSMISIIYHILQCWYIGRVSNGEILLLQKHRICIWGVDFLQQLYTDGKTTQYCRIFTQFYTNGWLSARLP